MAPKTVNGRVHDSYFELVREFPLTSIRSDRYLKEAQKVIDRLLAKGKLDRGEETYLDALSDLVELYEDEHYPIGPASDADMLRHLMEAKGLSQTLLHEGTGIPRSTISEILAGKRPFSKGVIAKLAKYFRVNVSILTTSLAR
jgi:HTH-type transcriptional regulator/antitoxin HigA